MDIRFLFRRPGRTVTSVSAAAGVNKSTASRWKNWPKGKAFPCDNWEHITKLYARGFLSDDDLRAAGLAIPRSPLVDTTSPAAIPASPSSPNSTEV